MTEETVKVWDIFIREGWRSEDHGDGSRVWIGAPGETWIATVSSKAIAVEHYCREEVCVIRDREGLLSECEDLSR